MTPRGVHQTRFATRERCSWCRRPAVGLVTLWEPAAGLFRGRRTVESGHACSDHMTRYDEHPSVVPPGGQAELW